jgi:hypothetical protein
MSGQGSTGFDPSRLLAALEAEGAAGPVAQTGKSYVFDCPKCTKRRRLYVRKRDGKFVCWYCRYTNDMEGGPAWLLVQLLNIPLAAANERLFGRDAGYMAVRLELPWMEAGEDESYDQEWTVMQWPYHYHDIDDPRAKRGREYLAGRGIPVDIARVYQIRYSPVDRRVAFPVYASGVLVGWQARLIIPHEFTGADGKTHSVPKILSSPDIPRDRVVMFQERLLDVKHAVITEGPVDAIKCHLVGGNIATMGKTISPGQLDALREAGVKRVYLGLDPDAAVETERLVKELSTDMEVYMVKVPAPYKDLGEMSFEEVREAVFAARPAHPWQLFVHLGGA